MMHHGVELNNTMVKIMVILLISYILGGDRRISAINSRPIG